MSSKRRAAADLIAAQHKRIGDDREAWAKVKAAAESGDLARFHEVYAAYLEQRGVISEARKLLIDMARATAKKLREVELPDFA